MDLSREARCPRCGYDLRGVVATWAAACPLESRCSECGLDFEWAEVIGARAPRPGWCVEFARSTWALPWRSIKTMAMTLWPWGFWRSLKMSHEMRWRRIAAYLVMLVLPLYLLQGVWHGAAAWAYWDYVYGNGALVMPPRVKVVVQSAVLPYSDTSPGVVTFQATRSRPAPVAWPFPPPAQQPRVDWGALVDGPVVPMLVGMLVLCPAGFLALPVSRRRAKVRYAHIHRVTLYSLTFVVLPISAMPAESLIRDVLWQLPAAQPLWGVPVIGVYALPLLLVIWWSCATGRYLKIRHAWGVGLAVVVMALLVTLLAFVLPYALAD
ncbi:MAG: hypothetical protein ACYTGF_06895 [Planctomycetota bacterium]|jgi:hypothetical protein